ncbi:hypothetical protein EVAR_23065_1 [Eumeta japonica]|uniref:Uncharacterized protein n=1 Tax=Eumeta variegata TaxID=151549 RepID=A0A4C1VMJ4_EUMVA|nr:hypothetical protein EVAR_23065_1 [Eumeta japonica]
MATDKAGAGESDLSIVPRRCGRGRRGLRFVCLFVRPPAGERRVFVSATAARQVFMGARLPPDFWEIFKLRFHNVTYLTYCGEFWTAKENRGVQSVVAARPPLDLCPEDDAPGESVTSAGAASVNHISAERIDSASF